MIDMIAVNEKVLASVLGRDEWPADVPLNNDYKRMAARCITLSRADASGS